MRNNLSEYYKVRHLIKTGDHLGWKSNNVVGSLIRAFSPGPINHSEIAIKIPFMGLGNRRFNVGALGGGTSLHLLSRQLKKYKGSVYWYPLRNEYDELRSAIAAFILQKLDIKYDFYSLFKNAFGRVSTEASRFFCSEICNWAWVNAGIDTGFPLNGKAPTPSDIHNMTHIFKEKRRVL